MHQFDIRKYHKFTIEFYLCNNKKKKKKKKKKHGFVV